MNDAVSPTPSELAFLAGGGEVGALIRAHDWSASPLGPPSTWPQSLRSVVGLLLSSKFPMFVAWGPELGFLYNDAYAEILGAKHPAALGARFYDIWTEIWTEIEPLIDAALAGEATFREDLPLVMNRKGFDEQTWFTFSYSPVPDESGRVAGMYCAVAETTGRVLAERRNASERERLARMFEQAPGFIAIANGPEHVFDFVNATYRRLFGNRDFVGKTVREALPGLEGQGFFELLDQVYSTGERFVARQVPIRLEPSPGAPPEERILDFIYEPIVDEAGQVTGIFCEGHDITERRRAEVVLQRETRALAIVNETGAAVAAERDLDRIVQMVTDAGRELTGAEFGAFFYNVVSEDGERYRLFALSGANPADFGDFPMPHITGLFQPTFQGERIVRSDDILADPRYGTSGAYKGMPAEHLPVRSYLAVPVVSRSGEVLGGLLYGHSEPGRFLPQHETLLSGIAGHGATAIDNARLFAANERELAERRRAEAALQALNATLEQRVAEAIAERELAEEALRQSQKMEAVGQLTGGIAHDFNNLLAGIMGSLDLMQTRITQGRTGDLARYVGAAMGSAQRAAALTHRPLAFSRRQPLDPKPVEANKLVAEMEDLLRRTLGPAISLEMVLAGGLWRTFCDPVQLESALLNLCFNARDAMPDGGRLTIETANAHLDDAYAAAERDITPGQYAAICVTDTGVGMSREVMARVFEPFFTTNPLGQGTGLGLSMVYGFAKQSEGHVRIYSEEGKGTTAKLYLPRYRGTDSNEDETQAQVTEAPQAEAGETVLVVEDEPVVRDLIVEVLGELGYQALEAGDGSSGLKLLQSRRRIDLLITDVGLPGINGRQLADQARERRPDLKVLFITGYAENATLAHGFLETGMAMLTKPFAVDSLMRKIRQLIEEKAGR